MASKTWNGSYLSSTTNTAGSTTNTSSLNLTSADGATITAQITNGGTAPTVACLAICQVCGDGSSWESYLQQSAGLSASATYSFSFDLPPSIMYARIQFVGNTGQSVSVAAQSQIVNSF